MLQSLARYQQLEILSSRERALNGISRRISFICFDRDPHMVRCVVDNRLDRLRLPNGAFTIAVVVHLESEIPIVEFICNLLTK